MTVPVADRGTTVIADRAVQRIAGRLIVELEGVGGSARRLLGLTVGAAGEEPNVQAAVKGEHVSLDVELSVSYPASVSQTTDAAREQLTTEVAAMTGLTVDRVDITVTQLRGDRSGDRRVE
jgi:uncharacterized alkaline shock family protein YloU